MKMCKSAAVVVAVLASVSSFASAATVYETGAATGYFTPFDSSTPAGTKLGDSGWFGLSSGDPAVALTEIRLGLATAATASAAAGTTDLVFTFNNGDPSGLVFGPGNALYSVVIPNVTLPAAEPGFASNFEVTIPLPSVLTAGGFNNVGWSVGVQNFNYTGSFGFQNKGANNNIGFYTNNYSRYNPATGTWGLFSFGAGTANIGNFVATISTPEPASLAAIGSLGGLLLKRRRSI
jgi:hypothetical protein